ELTGFGVGIALGRPFPYIEQAIAVLVLNRGAEDDGAPIDAIATLGSRPDRSRYRSSVGQHCSIQRHIVVRDPGWIVPGTAASRRNRVLVIDSGKRWKAGVDRGKGHAGSLSAILQNALQSYDFGFILRAVAYDVGDLGYRRGWDTLLGGRDSLIEAENWLAHR